MDQILFSNPLGAWIYGSADFFGHTRSAYEFTYHSIVAKLTDSVPSYSASVTAYVGLLIHSRHRTLPSVQAR